MDFKDVVPGRVGLSFFLGFKEIPSSLTYSIPFVGAIHKIHNLIFNTLSSFNYCYNVAVSKGKKCFME